MDDKVVERIEIILEDNPDWSGLQVHNQLHDDGFLHVSLKQVEKYVAER